VLSRLVGAGVTTALAGSVREDAEGGEPRRGSATGIVVGLGGGMVGDERSVWAPAMTDSDWRRWTDGTGAAPERDDIADSTT